MAEVVAAGASSAGLDEARIVVAPTQDALIAEVVRGVSPGDVILVKGSRGMHMERVAEAIRRGFAAADGKGTA